MHIDAWTAERAKRERAYHKLCVEGWRLGFHYDRTGEGVRAVFDIVRQIDQAYLHWCETDRWPVEYASEAQP